jgi:hypothetical protein
MSKFNRKTTRPLTTTPVTTTGETVTALGGQAWVRDSISELVMLAVVNMVGEATFHEGAAERDSRFAVLCQSAAVKQPADFLDFVTWLRGEANMRSASLVAAAVGVKARLVRFKELDELAPTLRAADVPAPPGQWNRKIVNAVLQRPDEPGEFLAYWTEHYGRNLPMPVKRGVGDAVRRMYNERALLKYDTDSHGWRWGDVLDLTHPAPADEKPWQGDLFTYALHRRHGYAKQIPTRLLMVDANRRFREEVVHAPYLVYDADRLRAAGMTWEDALSLSGSVGAEKRKVWEAMIPSMGIMALIRNLRNFDEAGVSDAVAQTVIAKLSDPAEIARSRQFPYRFLSAYRAAPTLRWGYGLEKALSLATKNVPGFRGRTLVMVDTSASMRHVVSEKSAVRHLDIAMLTGVVIANRSTGPVDLVGFANGWFDQPVNKHGSILRAIDAMNARVGEVGHGTNTAEALTANYRAHDRVVIVHDGQFGHWRHNYASVSTAIPAHVPLYSIDTSGYQASAIDTAKPNRYEVGGFSDKLFTMISLLDSGRSAKWPWQV